MLKKSVFTLAALAAVLTFQACNKEGRQTTPEGLEYEFHVNNEGETATDSSVVSLHLVIKNGKDSTITNTPIEGQLVANMTGSTPYKGSWEHGLKLMSEGDSATFYVPVDSLVADSSQLPPFIQPGSTVSFSVKMQKIQTMEVAMKEYEEKVAQAQKDAADAEQRYIPIDDSLITAYAAKNNLNVQQTASGLKYVVTKKGSGKKPSTGDTVSVHYTGKLLDGTVFDSSVERGQPIEFPIGQGNVIPGWDEGIALLNEGSKATFLIPSRLAYRSAGAGGVIPPNAVLLFDVELVDVK
jgi:FKBP-type peptidyl-prolyl cis-trans isomerase FkpA